MRISYALSALLFILTSSCTHSTKIQQASDEESYVIVPHQPVRNPSAEEIDWFAAADKQVLNATCRVSLPKTALEIAKYYAKLSKKHMTESSKYEVFGVQFENERPELVLAFSKLFIPNDFRAPKKSEQAPQNLNEKFTFNPKCKKVLCASETVFGKEVGPQMVYLVEHFDINTSPYTHGDASLFKSDEIADIIRSLELVDTSILPFKQGQKLTKFSRGYTLKINGPGVIANATIELFDSWSTQKSASRQYTVFHEFAHTFAYNHLQKYDTAQAWLALSGWNESEETAGDYYIAKEKAMKPHPFVSDYGKSNPFEDFAESVTAYRLNPALLKKQSAAKYDYIKYYVFDGLEYSSTKGCQSEPGIKKYQALIDRNEFPFSKQESEDIKSACRLDFYNLAFANGYQSTFKACVNYEASDVLLKKIFPKNQEVAPKSIYNKDFGLSNLRFDTLTQTIATELTNESTDWLLNELKSKAFKFRSSMNTNSYCEIWSEVKDSSFPTFFGQTKWRKNYYAPVKAKYTDRANPGKLFEMCKAISEKNAPTSRSAPSKIVSFLKTLTMMATRDVLKERNLSKEDIFENLALKTIPRK